MGEQFQTAGSLRYSDVDTEPEADEIYDSDSDSEYARKDEPPVLSEAERSKLYEHFQNLPNSPKPNGSHPEKRGAVEEHEGEIEDDGDVNSDDDSDASKKEVTKPRKGEPPLLSEAERNHLYEDFMKFQAMSSSPSESGSPPDKRGIDKKTVPFLVSYNGVFSFRNGRK